MQRTHYNTDFHKQQFPIYIICDQVINGLNLGGILRAADAFGIKEVFICGHRKELEKQVLRTSRSAEKFVKHSFYKSSKEVIEELQKNSVRIVALEITDQSQEVSKFDFSKDQPIALIIGSENLGISNDILAMAEDHIHINMFGRNSSMNVVQATSIALYELSKRFI